MWIVNVPGYAIPKADHPNPGKNSVLIQITDPDTPTFPIPKYQFKDIHQFRFLDMAEDNLDKVTPEIREHYQSRLITNQQAEEIVRILIDSYNNRANVIVHCSAGICRSGAVCEIGVMMGFEDISNNRIPNLLVKRKLLDHLYKSNFIENNQHEIN